MAAKTGLSASAIRYYERENLLPRVARQAGRRLYDRPLLERLVLIARARKAGFRIGEIRMLFGQMKTATPSNAWRSLANQKIAELDGQIASAVALREELIKSLECGCIDLGKCWLLKD